MNALIILYLVVFLISWFVCLYKKGKEDLSFNSDKVELCFICFVWPLALIAALSIIVVVPMILFLEWIADLPYQIGKSRKYKLDRQKDME